MKKKLLKNVPNLILDIPIKTFGFLIVLFLFSFNLSTAQNPNANQNGTENANENATVEGGIVSTSDGLNYVEVCVGDDVEDIVNFEVVGASGRLKQWVITDDEDNILYLPDSPSFDFNNEISGTCRVYHVSYNGMKPLVKPFWHKHIKNLFEDLRGKYDISDEFIEVKKIKQPKGGEIALADGTTEIEICAGDGISDLFDVNLEGAEGPNMIWVVTDTDANILSTSDEGSFDFEDEAGGISLIWHLSYAENVSLDGVTNANDLTGCFDLSNSITVIRHGVDAGDIEIAEGGTEIEICAGDGNSDAFDVNIVGDTEGTNYAWVITNEALDILDIVAPETTSFDFEDETSGIYLIWHIAFEDGLEGAEIGGNAANLTGCFNLSNPITVTNHRVDAGDIEIAEVGTEIEICAGDGNSDAFDVNVVGETEGANYAWVITDEALDILDILDQETTSFDFEETGGGVYLIWHIAFEDGLEGADIGGNASNLSGCYNLSNAITVTAVEVNGGTITGGTDNSFSFTVGDGTADKIEDGAITLEGNLGANSAWVVTNEDATIILDLPESYADVDFDDTGEGTSLVWHLSYEDGLQGLEVPEEGDHLIENLSGCFSLSNSISIVKTAASASKTAIYPNPAKGIVNVELSDFNKEEINIKIFTTQGLQIYDKTYKLNSSKAILDVSGYKGGLYFVKVTDGTGKTTTKGLVVN